jgi:hypothetical protein
MLTEAPDRVEGAWAAETHGRRFTIDQLDRRLVDNSRDPISE